MIPIKHLAARAGQKIEVKLDPKFNFDWIGPTKLRELKQKKNTLTIQFTNTYLTKIDDQEPCRTCPNLPKCSYITVARLQSLIYEFTLYACEVNLADSSQLNLFDHANT